MKRNIKPIIIVAAMALTCVLPSLLSKYVLHLIVYIMINSIAVMGLNILSSSGQISNAQAAFFGIGAYTSALMSAKFGTSFWVNICVVLVVTTIAGLLVGLPTMKVSGLYLIMTTMGINEIINQLMKNWISLTNGPKGISSIAEPVFFGIKLNTVHSYFYLAFAAFCIFAFMTSRIFRSRLGYYFTAIKNSSIASDMNGVNVNGIKLMAFAICSVYAGIAGTLYAHYISYIHPDNFTTGVSISFLTYSIFGGQGSIAGIVIATSLLTFATEYFRFIGEYRLVIYGAILILGMMYFPNGIGGLINKVTAKLANNTGHTKKRGEGRRNDKG